ncbi:MAG: LysR family transcriptional regulator [Roseovarius sp.]
MSKSPSMTALRAFEAVVRHGTLTDAARELCVTPAAISHRLSDLQAASSARLFERAEGVFVATPHGLAVLGQLGDAFQRIREAHEVMVGPVVNPVEVVVSYSFAVMWLLPNLADFQSRFPDTRISIQPTHKPITDSKPSTSLTIVHSEDRPEGAGWQRLFEDVCAILVAEGHPILRDDRPGWPARLRDYPLVHISHESGTRRGELSWRDWASIAGAAGMSFPIGLHVTAEHAALDVTMTSRALAIVSLINAERHLREGKAAVVPGSQILSGKSYWIRTRNTSKEASGKAAEFAAWIRASASASAERCKAR